MALSRGLADTSIFIAREAERPIREDSLPKELAVSVITIGELRASVLAANDTPTRDRRLSTLEAALVLQPVPIDDRVAAAWARLRIVLRDQSLNMAVNDSWKNWSGCFDTTEPLINRIPMPRLKWVADATRQARSHNRRVFDSASEAPDRQLGGLRR